MTKMTFWQLTVSESVPFLHSPKIFRLPVTSNGSKKLLLSEKVVLCAMQVCKKLVVFGPEQNHMALPLRIIGKRIRTSNFVFKTRTSSSSSNQKEGRKLQNCGDPAFRAFWLSTPYDPCTFWDQSAPRLLLIERKAFSVGMSASRHQLSTHEMVIPCSTCYGYCQTEVIIHEL